MEVKHGSKEEGEEEGSEEGGEEARAEAPGGLLSWGGGVKLISKCGVETCARTAWARGWCNTHYSRWYKYGDPLAPPQPRRVDDRSKRIGAEHSLFRDGAFKEARGYIVLSSKVHGADCGRREHRVIVERAIGRRLRADEIVHHVNGNKADNRVENLRIETRRSHGRLHAQKLGAMVVCGECGASRYYRPSNLAKVSASGYVCLSCRATRSAA